MSTAASLATSTTTRLTRARSSSVSTSVWVAASSRRSRNRSSARSYYGPGLEEGLDDLGEYADLILEFFSANYFHQKNYDTVAIKNRY